jgi:hypothetical protein
MTTNIPFLLRFATPLGHVRESGGAEGIDAASAERNFVVTESSLNSRGETRFTRVRNETTDDE